MKLPVPSLAGNGKCSTVGDCKVGRAAAREAAHYRALQRGIRALHRSRQGECARGAGVLQDGYFPAYRPCQNSEVGSPLPKKLPVRID